MALELIYTSSPRGLRAGTTGYTTVACTQGMPASHVEALEALSGYKLVYAAGDAKAGLNPVSYAHRRIALGGKTLSVLSRVAFSGFDHTGRTNKIAHHLLLDRSEWPAAGPAWVLAQPEVLVDRWEGEPRYLTDPKNLPNAEPTPSPARAWGNLVGDPGWAGVLAQTADSPTQRPAYLIYEPGMELLPLLVEAVQLLRLDRRWNVTFDTYLHSLPASNPVAWRCCLADSPAAKEAPRVRDALVIDLRQGRALGQAGDDSPYVRAARTGEAPQCARPVAPAAFVKPVASPRARPVAPLEGTLGAPPPTLPLILEPEPEVVARPVHRPVVATPRATERPPARWPVAVAIALFLSLAGNVALVVLHPASRGRQTEEALGPNDASSTDGDATAPTAQSTALLEEKLREADRKREEDGKEIDRLKTEKTQLASDKKDLETKVVTLTEEKEKLREERDAAYQNPGPPADDGPAPAPLEGGPIPESEANRIQYAWLPLPETLPERLDIPRTVDGARWEKVDVRLRPNGPIREEDLKKEPGSLAVGTKDLLDMNPKSGWDLTITCSGQRLEIARQLNAAERWKQLIASVQWLILEDNEGHECHYLVQPLDPVDRDWPAGRATLPIPLAFLDAWEPDPPTIALQRKARTIAVSWEQSQEGLDLHAVFFKERWAAARDACRGAPEVTGLSSTKQDEFRESRDKANTDLKSLLDKSKHFPDKETEEKTALSPVEVKALGDFRKILKDIEVLQPELENLLPKDANDWARRYKAARDTLLGILDSRDLNALSRAGSEEAVIEMTAPDNSGKLQKIQVIRITFQG